MPGRSFLENPALKENPGIRASISVEGSLGTMIWLLPHSFTQPSSRAQVPQLPLVLRQRRQGSHLPLTLAH